ncbi:MAG: phosphoglycerate kinase [Terriglobia bacterium]
MGKFSIRDLALTGHRVFVRVDFNVPLDAASRVTDDTRIRESLPTIQYALQQRARVVLSSHLGRPKGKPNPKMSLRPVAERLATLLGQPVQFAEDCIGKPAEQKSQALKEGELLLLENLRFHIEEEKNDAGFARALAGLVDKLYVNDAFGSAHRAHASTQGITRFVERAAAGFLMEKELTYLTKAIASPDRPYVAVLGGAKVSDKIKVIANLLRVVDTLILGGGMAYTFLKAKGIPIGTSLVEDDKLALAGQLLEEAARRSVQVLLPVDHLVARTLDPAARTQIVGQREIPDEQMALDIGPKTVEAFISALTRAKTILWNGPMGVFEHDAFTQGTLAVARALAESGATSIVGGGDSIAAVRKAGVTQRMTHISTGGGATLEFLGGRKLPGVEALTDLPDPKTGQS